MGSAAAAAEVHHHHHHLRLQVIRFPCTGLSLKTRIRSIYPLEVRVMFDLFLSFILLPGKTMK